MRSEKSCLHRRRSRSIARPSPLSPRSRRSRLVPTRMLGFLERPPVQAVSHTSLAIRGLQADYLRSLNRRGEPDAVIRAFEGGHVATTEAALGEYVKALALVDRLDNTALLQTLSVRPLGTHLPSEIHCTVGFSNR